VIATPASGSDVAAFPSRVWLVAAVVVVLGAAGGVVAVTRARRSRHVCRVCGTRLETTGDMCATCRHEAADTLRRAAADRQRVQDDQERQLHERDEDERRRVARDAEDAQLRQQEEARRHDEEAQRLEEETRQREAQVVASQPVAVEETVAVFDPYAVLDVPRDATAEAIQTAYDQAKAKYDPDLVSGLGLEVQDHYKAKAEAVERAFKLLTAI
jgi:DnaJ-domain-containing protein 1